MNGPAPSSASPNRAAAPTSVRSSIAPRPAASWKFVASIVAAFLAVLLPVIVHHQMWRDELDGWTWALESPSLVALLHLVPYEGHPPLFFMLLYALTRVTANPLAMKLLHAGLAAATVAVVAAKAPWPRLARVLFAFGYFPLFEFGVISRDYVLGMLLGFVACAIISGRRARPIALAIVLVLMGQTNVYAMILSLALALAAVVDWLCRWMTRGDSAEQPARPASVAIGAALIVVGVAIFVLSMRAPADAGYASGWRNYFSRNFAELVFNTAFRAMVPIPSRPLHFWGNNFLDPWVHVQLAATLFLAAIATAAVARRPAALTMLVTAIAGLMLFEYFKYLGTLRHQGHIFLAVLMSDWLSRTTARWPFRQLPEGEKVLATGPELSNGRPDHRWQNGWLFTLLAIQVVAALYATGVELRYPFSDGQKTAQYIQANYPPDMPVVGEGDAACSTVASYLRRPIFYVAGHRWGIHLVWDRLRMEPVTPADVFAAAADISRQQGRDVLVVFNRQYENDLTLSAQHTPHPPPQDRLVWSSGDAIVPDEMYDVYLVPVAR